MAPNRQDNFVESLKILQTKYPEYENILKLLIEQVQRGQTAGIQEKLQQLRREDGCN